MRIFHASAIILAVLIVIRSLPATAYGGWSQHVKDLKSTTECVKVWVGGGIRLYNMCPVEIIVANVETGDSAGKPETDARPLHGSVRRYGDPVFQVDFGLNKDGDDCADLFQRHPKQISCKAVHLRPHDVLYLGIAKEYVYFTIRGEVKTGTPLIVSGYLDHMCYPGHPYDHPEECKDDRDEGNRSDKSFIPWEWEDQQRKNVPH